MKFIVLAFTLLVSHLALASSEVVVMEFFKPYNRLIGKSEFAINRDAGRAWVTATLTSNLGGREQERTSYRQKLEGLSFDNATNAIVYNGVVCATVRTRGYGPFRYEEVTNTGCKLGLKEVTRTVDNGYQTYKVQAVQVILTVL